MRVAQGNQTPMRIIRPEGRGQLGKQLGEGRAWAPRAPLLLTAPTPLQGLLHLQGPAL